MGFSSSAIPELLNGAQINYTRAINAAVAGGFASFLGEKGIGATEAGLGLKEIFYRIVIQNYKSFLKSSSAGASSMYAYDYVNR